MIDALLNILSRGYTPITYEYTESVYDAALDTMTSVTNEVIPAGMAGVDWEFVLAAAVLIVGVYCIFRLVGSIISGVL